MIIAFERMPRQNLLHSWKREGWKTAQSCYGAESKMYGSEEEDLKAGCIARCARVTKKIREKERDIVLDAEDIINGTIDIELDE